MKVSCNLSASSYLSSQQLLVDRFANDSMLFIEDHAAVVQICYLISNFVYNNAITGAYPEIF